MQDVAAGTPRSIGLVRHLPSFQQICTNDTNDAAWCTCCNNANLLEVWQTMDQNGAAGCIR
jgi:hypothetical protein